MERMAPQKSIEVIDQQNFYAIDGDCVLSQLTVSGHSPRHTDLSVAEWEDLGTVGERHWSFAWRVESSKDEDEQGNKCDMCSA